MECSTDWPRRLLISQDSFEIYFTIATFEPAYKEYLRDEQHSNILERSFMIMNQYGPWVIDNQKHMSQLGRLILAFTLKFCPTSDDPFD